MNKKLLSVFLFIIMVFVLTPTKALANNELMVDANNFPDGEFRQYIKDSFDTNKDGNLSNEEIKYITQILISEKSSIESLVGIEHFTELLYLSCPNTKVRVLDVSKNIKLQYLICNNTNIQMVNVKNNPELIRLYCYEAKLSKLDIDVKINTKFDEAYFENQSIVAKYEIDPKTSKVICDLKKVVGDISKVSVRDYYVYTYDNVTGILTFTGSPVDFEYSYSTGYINTKEQPELMNVRVKQSADYSKVDEAMAKIPKDMSKLYTEESIKAVNDATAAAIRDKKADEQSIVDGYAKAIEAAIAGLKYRVADYSKVDEAMAKIPKDMSKLYTEESIKAVNDATAVLIRDKKADEQSIVDGYAKAIEAAIAGLKYRVADYSKVDEAIAKIPEDMSKLYTEESIKAVNDATAAVIRDKKADEQSIVDGYAKAIETAIKELKKPDNNNDKPGENEAEKKPGENKPEKKPGENKPNDNVKTADNSNMMLYMMLVLISMVGVITVIGVAKRKKETEN